MTHTKPLKVLCPDCGCDLVIDAATGQILIHKAAPTAPAGGQKFEDLLAGLDYQKAEAEETFAREVAAHKDRDRLLEEKFRVALQRAKEDPDDATPPRPFDLD